METQELTLVTLVAERILRDRLLDRIHELGARGHTLTDVTGEGTSQTYAHEWEGPSVKIETLVPEDVAARIVAAATKYFQHHAVIVYTQTVRVVRRDRF